MKPQHLIIANRNTYIILESSNNFKYCLRLIRNSVRSISIFAVALTLCFTSCDYGAGQDDHIIGRYYVGWIERESHRSIYVKETPNSSNWQTIVMGYVFAVGNDSRYIIAKTIDRAHWIGPYFHIIDTKGYYNTNMDNNNYWEFSSEFEYHQKLAELGISNIKFDKQYPEDI
ncbi:MAG: hypothetical protein IPF62_15055 [Bacteroidetes bacterium]|nr:hypothetical protein [Bacteroidota bacterium]MBK7041570.1 hypothetical protein [Bacteroidota bacterium]